MKKTRTRPVAGEAVASPPFASVQLPLPLLDILADTRTAFFEVTALCVVTVTEKPSAASFYRCTTVKQEIRTLRIRVSPEEPTIDKQEAVANSSTRATNVRDWALCQPACAKTPLESPINISHALIFDARVLSSPDLLSAKERREV